MSRIFPHTYTTTYVTCPDCDYRVELAQDDEDENEYYVCCYCRAEWTLEGKKRVQ